MTAAAWQHVEDGNLGAILTSGGAYCVEWYAKTKPEGVAPRFYVRPSSARSGATHADRERALVEARRFADEGHPSA